MLHIMTLRFGNSRQGSGLADILPKDIPPHIMKNYLIEIVFTCRSAVIGFSECPMFDKRRDNNRILLHVTYCQLQCTSFTHFCIQVPIWSMPNSVKCIFQGFFCAFLLLFIPFLFHLGYLTASFPWTSRSLSHPHFQLTWARLKWTSHLFSSVNLPSSVH